MRYLPRLAILASTSLFGLSCSKSDPIPVADAGMSDAGASDVGARDAGGVDAGPMDAGTADAGRTDTGTTDATTEDSGVIDASSADGGPVDANASDAGPPDDGGVVAAGFVSPLYPVNGTLFNSWVANDGADWLSATGVPCALVGPEVTTTDACWPAGEMRQFTVPGLSTCAGVTAVDDLGAFEWACDASPGSVRVVSRRLRPDVRVSELIDWSTQAFRPNAVSVSLSGTVVASSEASVWWTNPIFELTSASPTALPTAYGIYLVEADPAKRFVSNVEGVVIVVHPSAAMTAPGENYVLRSESGLRFPWFEGAFDGTGLASTSAFTVTSLGAFCTMRHLRIQNGYLGGLNAVNCHGGRVEDVLVEDLPGTAIDVRGQYARFSRLSASRVGHGISSASGVTGSTFEDLRVNQASLSCWTIDANNPELIRGVTARGVRLGGCGEWGARVIAAETEITDIRVFDANLGDGMYLSLPRGLLRHATVIGSHRNCIDARNSSSAVFADILCGANGRVPSGGDGFLLNQGTTGAVLSRSTVLNSAVRGFVVEAGTSTLFNLSAQNNGGGGLHVAARANQVYNVAALDNAFEAEPVIPDVRILHYTPPTPNVFGGLLFTSPQPNYCALAPGLSPATAGIDTGCSGLTEEWPLVSASLMPYWSYVAKVRSDDSANTDDVDGLAAYDDISDWSNFESRARGWAREAPLGPADGLSQQSGYGWPGPLFRGRCASGEVCRIWDFDISAADVALKNRHVWPPTDQHAGFPTSITHTFASTSQAQCSQNRGGGSWNGTACTLTFLNNAIELDEPGAGNGNGLCESNERCLHARNFGHYQGHGSLVLVDSAVNTGGVSGVTLYRYFENGR